MPADRRQRNLGEYMLNNWNTAVSRGEPMNEDTFNTQPARISQEGRHHRSAIEKAVRDAVAWPHQG